MNLFSFYKKKGFCKTCRGSGILEIFDEKLILDKNKSIYEGGILPFQQNNKEKNIRNYLDNLFNYHKINIYQPLKEMDNSLIHILLYGSKINLNNDSSQIIKGIIPILEYYQLNFSDYENIQKWLKKFKSNVLCSHCSGSRLNNNSLSYKINNKNIYELNLLTVYELLNFFEKIELTEMEKKIITLPLDEIIKRLTLLKKLDLEYLTLNQNLSTLSGGETQRIFLVNQIGSKLTGVIYILDEPSIGLHPYNNQKMIEVFHQLVNLGNTLLVIEHDPEIILAADYIIDLGPGSGKEGGKIIGQGLISDILNNKHSLTGNYFKKNYFCDNQNNLYIKKKISPGEIIEIRNACVNNLKNIDIDIPLGLFTVITGVSGSGKSTLINDVLYQGLKKIKNNTNLNNKKNKVLLKSRNVLQNIIYIQKSDLKKNKKTNLINYIELLNPIRNLFLNLPEAKARGYNKNRFSSSSIIGRCHGCHGEGVKKIFMPFLSNLLISCEQCKGKRFNSETLEIKYKEKNISDIYDMTISEASLFFNHHNKIKIILKLLEKIGLNYLNLGYKLNNLSEGEMQRLFLVKQIQKNLKSNNIYIFDEPSKGLHSFEIEKLNKLIETLIKKQNTVIIIEHNIDIIQNADYIIDLGPKGGKNGGYIVAKGNLEQIIKTQDSYTGQYLKKRQMFKNIKK
ncbi:MAG: ATP-binding cassette domain-containing protein [Candidatus Phytoplasma stylosanthis]|nr:ATP-binding cassette domain-containing protein [Candidatus Phytoplasma stylosanthis]